MKGLVEEAVWAVVLILSVIILSFFFIYQQGLRGAEVRRTVEERVLNEEGISTIFSIFNNKLLFADKTYMELAIDSVLQGEFIKEEQNQVYYGRGIGKLNTSEIIPPLLDNYIRGRWRIEVITPDGTYVYGKPDLGNVVYSYRSVIPVPEERVGEIILYID